MEMPGSSNDPREKWNNSSMSQFLEINRILLILAKNGTLPGRKVDDASLSKLENLIAYMKNLLENTEFWKSLPETLTIEEKESTVEISKSQLVADFMMAMREEKK